MADDCCYVTLHSEVPLDSFSFKLATTRVARGHDFTIHAFQQGIIRHLHFPYSLRLDLRSNIATLQTRPSVLKRILDVYGYRAMRWSCFAIVRSITTVTTEVRVSVDSTQDC
eukprot:scaffold445036_cov33-Prasinocladus_malaysianus.AAC.1